MAIQTIIKPGSEASINLARKRAWVILRQDGEVREVEIIYHKDEDPRQIADERASALWDNARVLSWREWRRLKLAHKRPFYRRLSNDVIEALLSANVDGALAMGQVAIEQDNERAQEWAVVQQKMGLTDPQTAIEKRLALTWMMIFSMSGEIAGLD